MATIHFSIPDDVEQEFNALFVNENKNAVFAELIRHAIEERKRTQRRKAVFERIERLRESAPTASNADIRRARDEWRE